MAVRKRESSGGRDPWCRARIVALCVTFVFAAVTAWRLTDPALPRPTGMFLREGYYGEGDLLSPELRAIYGVLRDALAPPTRAAFDACTSTHDAPCTVGTLSFEGGEGYTVHTPSDDRWAKLRADARAAYGRAVRWVYGCM